MQVHQFATALVFLGAITTVNAQSNAGQADESFLVAEKTQSTESVDIGQAQRTVSAIESRELREHINDELTQTLSDKLSTQFNAQFADISVDWQ